MSVFQISVNCGFRPTSERILQSCMLNYIYLCTLLTKVCHPYLFLSEICGYQDISKEQRSVQTYSGVASQYSETQGGGGQL